MIGGLATADETPGDYRRYLAEVTAFMESNPLASIRTVALCCNMSNRMAESLMQKVTYNYLAIIKKLPTDRKFYSKEFGLSGPQMRKLSGEGFVTLVDREKDKYGHKRVGVWMATDKLRAVI